MSASRMQLVAVNEYVFQFLIKGGTYEWDMARMSNLYLKNEETSMNYYSLSRRMTSSAFS